MVLFPKNFDLADLSVQLHRERRARAGVEGSRPPNSRGYLLVKLGGAVGYRRIARAQGDAHAHDVDGVDDTDDESYVKAEALDERMPLLLVILIGLGRLLVGRSKGNRQPCTADGSYSLSAGRIIMCLMMQMVGLLCTIANGSKAGRPLAKRARMRPRLSVGLMIGMCFLTGIAPTAALVGTASFKQSVNLAKQGGSPALALASTARSVANRAVAPPPTRLAPPPMSMEMVVHNRRRLEIVSDTSGLVSALSGSATTIELEAGTYTISSTLTVSRDVTIKAKVSGSSVVLDGGDSTRIMRVQSGNEAHLIGLTFKDGYDVSVPAGPHSPSSLRAVSCHTTDAAKTFQPC